MDHETLIQIAEEHGTPTYVYDLNKVRDQIKTLKQSFKGGSKTEFLYAVKANYNYHLVEEVIKQGFGIDAVSPEEVRLALVSKAVPNKIMFTGNNMTNIEMIEVHEKLKVLLNIGSISRLEKFGEEYPGSEVCIRVNPNVGDANHNYNITAGPDSKFGISNGDVKKALDIADQYKLKIVGIHQHIGSGWLNLDSPMKALEVILDTAKQIPKLKFVDFGGGFGIPYSPDQNELDVGELGRRINERFFSFCEEYGKKLILRLEPGRYVVGQAGHLLVEVNTLKQGPEGKIIAGTDSGMNHMIRVPLYDAYHGIFNLSNPEGELKTHDVCGNICESSDFFARDRPIPEIREGDFISIEDTGAYGFVQASNYQLRPRPAEVVVDGNKIILSRKRETFNDLMRGMWN